MKMFNNRQPHTRVPADAAATGDLSAAARLSRTTDRTRTARASSRDARGAARVAASRVPAQTDRASRRPAAAPRKERGGERADRAAGASRRESFMRYASDNRVVRAVYDFTTGPWKPLLIAGVALVVAVSIYFPVRDYYVAYRTNDILQRQLEVREAYNENLEDEVNKLLSTDGIADAARSDLGLVMPGEKRIDVIGDDGEDSSATSDGEDADAADGDGGSVNMNPTTSTELEAAEQAILNDRPWYIQMLDTVFFYQGVAGQKVTSTGE